jgi:hypothetical protein
MPLSRSNILIVEDQAIIVLRKSPRQALTGQVPPQDSLMRRRSLAIRDRTTQTAGCAVSFPPRPASSYGGLQRS